MTVDPLTKGMPPLKFNDHVDRMGLSSFCMIFVVRTNVICDETLFM